MAGDAEGPAPRPHASSPPQRAQNPMVSETMNLLHSSANLQDSVIFTLQQPLARSQAEACKFRSVHRRSEFLAHI